MFVHVSRCLIYKVHSAVSRAFIVSHQVSFVKNFFQILSNFLWSARRFAVSRSAANSFSLAHLHPFVKNFFRISSSFFLNPVRFAAPFRTLGYDTIEKPVCQPFFSYFFIFLKNLYYVGFLSLLIFGLSLMKEKLRRDLTQFPEILKLISLRNIWLF